MQFKVEFATDIGRRRTQNQDNLAALPELGLFIIADGMGGHRGGETASAIAVDVVTKTVAQAEKIYEWNPHIVIVDAIKDANRTIFRNSQEKAELQGMGTTTTALLFHGDDLTIGHVGDSRCYYFLPEAIWQVTRDHSLVQEKLRAGLINREEAKTDRMKNVITRSVGFEPDLNIEVFEMTVKPKDLFLVCSDGLSGLVDEKQMLEIVQEEFFRRGDLKAAVQKLIEAANENGGDDNISVIMVQWLGPNG